MALKLITPPASSPITLAEAKAHLNVDYTDDDVLIQTMIDAATAHVDGPVGFLGRAIIDQTWELTLDEFPTAEIVIPMPPLIEVVSVKYDDSSGTEQTISALDYVVDNASEPARVWYATTWPTTFTGINAVRVRFRAGYLDTSVSPAVATVPADIKAAIKLYVGSLYGNRETEMVGASVAPMPWSAEQLLRRKRIDLSMA
jgi:uncharacterized phiE125 gp8 family phage protein